MRSILRTKGVGPDALPPPPPPPPPGRPKDWLDDILDGNAAPPAADEPADEPADDPDPAPQQPPTAPTAPAAKAPPAKPKKPKKRRQPTPGTPRAAFDHRPESPRQSLLDAYDRTPHRLKWLTYHAAAAAAGWWLGWVGWATSTAAWLAAGHGTSISAWVLYALAALVIALYRRTRAWLWLAAWAAAIPACSVVVGVLLYGTGHYS
jgi:hypothetical protein